MNAYRYDLEAGQRPERRGGRERSGDEPPVRDAGRLRNAALSLPWYSAPRPYFIRIEPDSITGRRFEVTGNARSAVLPGPLRYAADEYPFR